jgi:hypothetical protein
MYVVRIKCNVFKQIFPLYLFYIKVFIMILPKMKTEGLNVRYECFVELANTMYRLPLRPEDPELSKSAQYLSKRDPSSFSEQSAMFWVFIYTWA